MAGFLPTILAPLDALRSIGGILGLRAFTVKVRVRSWTGDRPGLGSYADQDTVLQNQAPPGVTPSLYPVLARYVTTREVIASGGLWRDRDIRVGPMTPAYAAAIGMLAGGYGESNLDPAVALPAREVFWNVAGPDMPAGGVWCSKVQELSTALHYIVVLRTDGKQP